MKKKPPTTDISCGNLNRLGNPHNHRVKRPFMKFKNLYLCREMLQIDLEQVSAIEKDAFPDLFPPTSFIKELKKTRSTALVAEMNNLHPDYDSQLPTTESSLKKKRNTYRGGYTGWQKGQNFIAGYAIVWDMVDVAHIISIAVRRNMRRRGIGELLLLNVISTSREKGMSSVTLEVRNSNLPAQSLYEKFNFRVEGIRKHYYTDNREDALIMTTDNLTSMSHREQQILRSRSEHKYGQT
tara:strand:+ start:19732 stop:20448 length:717 start_codon:yes stop_codon:yes gene_type:complete